MTVDIIRAETTALATLDGANDALARLSRWVEAASNAHRLVVPLIDTYFIPDVYRPKVDPRATAEQKAEARQIAIGNATAAVLQGITLGLDPMTALQEIYVVHGRPGLYAKIKVALVQSRGHEVWTEDLSDSRAVVAGRRKGSDVIERVTVTMEQARKGGWTRNEAYAKTPQDMLWARAVSRVCDRIASDALMGIASVEEIQDELAPPGAGTRTVTPPRRRSQPPAALPAAPAEPPLDDEDVAADDTQVNTQDDARAAGAGEPRGAQPPQPPEPAQDRPAAGRRTGRRAAEPAADTAPPLDEGWPEPAQPGGGGAK